MLADSSRSLNSTNRSMADPTPHDALSTLALLELLLAETPPSPDSSDSSVSLQPEAAEPSQSHTEAARVKTEVDSPLLQPTAVPSAGTSTQILAGTSAQTPSAFIPTQTSSASASAQTLRGTSTQTSPACTSAQTPGDIWALAWQPLEASQAAQAQQAKHAQRAKHAQQANRSPSAVHATAKSPGLSSLRFWRQQQGPDADGPTDKQQEQHYTSGQFHICSSTAACLPCPLLAFDFPGHVSVSYLCTLIAAPAPGRDHCRSATRVQPSRTAPSKTPWGADGGRPNEECSDVSARH